MTLKAHLKPMLLAAGAVLFVLGCDSAEPDECPIARTDSYTQSAIAVNPASSQTVARFEMQQDVDSYLDDSCTPPASGVSRTRLVVRNLTSCDLSFTYRLSTFVGQEGTTVTGSVSAGPDAISDQGTIFSDSGIRLDQSQVVLTIADVVQRSCR